MSKRLRGKCLVRKSKLKDGRDVLVLCGMFIPLNFDIEEISSNDEMWVSDIIIPKGGLKYTDPVSIDDISPEDFLEGAKQSTSNWKTKSSL